MSAPSTTSFGAQRRSLSVRLDPLDSNFSLTRLMTSASSCGPRHNVRSDMRLREPVARNYMQGYAALALSWTVRPRASRLNERVTVSNFLSYNVIRTLVLM
jgi:hypothetical protein